MNALRIPFQLLVTRQDCWGYLHIERTTLVSGAVTRLAILTFDHTGILGVLYQHDACGGC
jgi:hypothetical protein